MTRPSASARDLTPPRSSAGARSRRRPDRPRPAERASQAVSRTPNVNARPATTGPTRPGTRPIGEQGRSVRTVAEEPGRSGRISTVWGTIPGGTSCARPSPGRHAEPASEDRCSCDVKLGRRACSGEDEAAVEPAPWRGGQDHAREPCSRDHPRLRPGEDHSDESPTQGSPARFPPSPFWTGDPACPSKARARCRRLQLVLPRSRIRLRSSRETVVELQIAAVSARSRADVRRSSGSRLRDSQAGVRSGPRGFVSWSNADRLEVASAIRRRPSERSRTMSGGPIDAPGTSSSGPGRWARPRPITWPGGASRSLLVEQFALGHDRGSSHGAARITRHSYADPAYARLMLDAFRRLARAGGRRRPRRSTSGPAASRSARRTSTTSAGSRQPGRDRRPAPADDRAASWNRAHPGLRPPRRPTTSSSSPTPGMLAAARAVRGRGRAGPPARAATTEILRTDARSGGSTSTATGRPWSSTTGPIEADRLIVTAGAWTGRLLPGLADPLRPTRQQVLYFRPADPAPFAIGRFPVFIYKGGATSTPSTGCPRRLGMGVKVARHGGPDVDPDAVDRRGRRGLLATVRGVPRRTTSPAWPRPRSTGPRSASTRWPRTSISGSAPCPAGRDVIVASPCSGHGFKFSCLIGRVLADLAIDGPDRSHDRSRPGGSIDRDATASERLAVDRVGDLGEVLEPGEVLEEGELDRAGGPVAVLGDDQLGDPGWSLGS